MAQEPKRIDGAFIARTLGQVTEPAAQDSATRESTLSQLGGPATSPDLSQTPIHRSQQEMAALAERATANTLLQGGGALPPTSFPREPAAAPTLASATGAGDGSLKTLTDRSSVPGLGAAASINQGQVGTDVQFDQSLVDLLKQRSQGIGVGPSGEDVASGAYEPLSRILNKEADKAIEQSLEILSKRGALASGETRDTVKGIQSDLFNRKAAIIGQLTLDAEDRRQKQMGDSIAQLGILEGQRVSAKVTLTTANLQSATQIQTQLIASETAQSVARTQAGAQTTSAKISAEGQRQSTMIAAQAALQRAGMDYDLAIKSLDRDLEMRGIDAERFETDPVYRAARLQERKFAEEAKDQLIFAMLTQQGFDMKEGA